MFRFLLILALLCTFSISLFAESQITLTSGNVYIGKIISETDTELRLKTLDGIMVHINKDKIESISSPQTRITTQSGNVYTGTVVEESRNHITMNTSDGINVEIPRNQILNRTTVNPSAPPQQAPAQQGYYLDKYGNRQPMGYYPQNNYTSHGHLGISLLFPGGINLVFGSTSNDIGFRFQAGYADVMYGLMGTFLINLKQTPDFEINLGICAGYTSIEDEGTIYTGGYSPYYEFKTMVDWTYAGATVDFNYKGLFAEIGLVVGDFEYISQRIESPQVLIQFGYLFRI